VRVCVCVCERVSVCECVFLLHATKFLCAISICLWSLSISGLCLSVCERIYLRVISVFGLCLSLVSFYLCVISICV